jgi:cytoskeletal protein CcmA (bactofilin family)
VFGKVSAGSVSAQERVDIRQGASVEADLTCQTLAIQEGAYFCGKVSMTGRQPKPEGATNEPAAAKNVVTPAAAPAPANTPAPHK